MTKEPGSTAAELEDFFGHFRTVAKPSGRLAKLSAFQLVDRWRVLVADITSGYEDDLDSYEDDLGVRACLERALRSESLLRWQAWRRLSAEIAAADAELRAVLQRGPVIRRSGPWWAVRLPPNVDDEFRAEAESRFGVLWADQSANDALFHVLDLLDRTPRPPDAAGRRGASPAQLESAEAEVEIKLPTVLRTWLRRCNGLIAGPGTLLGASTSDPSLDAVREQARWPGWRERHWWPVATDGSGNAYVMGLASAAGFVSFVDSSDPERLDYVCASNLPQFLTFLLERELGERRWPFDEAYVLSRDPSIAVASAAPLPWQA